MSALLISLLFLVTVAEASSPRVIEVKDNQLMIDQQKQPQLFGAEVQYFRLRGDYGPNVPRAKVLALWNKALDHFVDAKMNAISFYIPWDFHEYAEGKFDFTGTADVDKDGNADYPSRDVITFFKMIEARGITRIMVRPGPYINAEWGFLGFGAIPSWFHDKYLNSHMRTPYGLRSKLYDYHDSDLVRHSALWFKALNDQVLDKRMGPGKPIVFLQLDNETNYQWQPIYSHDYGQNSITRYQKFLNDLYKNIDTVNKTHGRKWDRWTQIQPPMFQGRNVSEDQDWYQFADYSIYTFLNKLRNIWSQLGVDEPKVLLTLAESYNAPVNGLLPHFVFRNAKQFTGLMTVNLYPKTFEESHKPLLNFPFKADLDVKAADEANDSYFGSRQEWVMGPEIQGGWWRGIDISDESRQQTYLTVLGHGMKAFFIYYFNEGQNWDAEWSYNQIKPLYDELLWERRLSDTANLSEDFWNELQGRTDRRILVGFDVRRIMKLGPLHDKDLFFDAPLDGEANPRDHYLLLKKIGENVVAPHQDFLARSLEVHDDVALVKDSTSHSPVADRNIPSVQAASDWSGGLLGYLMNADINPRILHGELSSEDSFKEAKVLVHLDTGLNATQTIEHFKRAGADRTVINFLSDDLANKLGFTVPSSVLFARESTASALVPLEFYVNDQGQLRPAGELGTKPVQIFSSRPVYQYDLSAQPEGCEGILFSENKVVGYHCKKGESTFIQVGALIFEDYNSGAYAQLPDPLQRKQFLKSLVAEANLDTRLQLSDEAKQTVTFARKDPEKSLIWVTVKSGATTSQSFSLKVSAGLLQDSLKKAKNQQLVVTDLLSKKSQKFSRRELSEKGFPIHLAPNGSTVFTISVDPSDRF